MVPAGWFRMEPVGRFSYVPALDLQTYSLGIENKVCKLECRVENGIIMVI